jgi:hypothetical protein
MLLWPTPPPTAAPEPMVTSAAVVDSPLTLGKAPLNASWDPASCACAAGDCWYNVTVMQLATGDLLAHGDTVLQSNVSNKGSPQFSGTGLTLTDGTSLVVHVQCVDAFGRGTGTSFQSSPTLVVTRTRRVSLASPLAPSDGPRGFVNSFQPSRRNLSFELSIFPLVLEAVTVTVVRMVPKGSPQLLRTDWVRCCAVVCVTESRS